VTRGGKVGSVADKMMGGYLICGNHYWGWGVTLAEAKARFRFFGGRLGRGYEIFEFSPTTECLGVTSIGYVQWNGDEPKHTLVNPRRKK
jgi:hypothetical protein